MGCCSSKPEEKDATKSNAPTNLAPILLPSSNINSDGGGIPLQSTTNNRSSITSPIGMGGYPEVTPASPPPDNKGKVYLARYAYQARTTEDLSFEKGEHLQVIGNRDSDWWLAKSLKSHREGYIPKNYVAEAQSYEAEE